MKLNEEKYKTRSSKSIRESIFKIGDGSHIIKLLRESLYSNPILAICREIASNCRDAHREVGTHDRPIRISLPNILDDNIHFQDWGPGISPSRMEDVYVKFGNSTKRDNNIETGGFGLGAKTPFAYTSSFIIETISKIEAQSDVDILNESNENVFTLDKIRGKHLKCNYIASLGGDGGQNGGVKLFNASITDDETGTTVTIGVRNNDRKKFIDAVIKSTKHWTTKPEVVGDSSFKYPIFDKILVEGSRWKIYSTTTTRYHYSDNKKQYAIVDGIEYPLDLNHIIDSINDHNLQKFIKALSCTSLVLEFDTGELSLTPNREDLHYNRQTIDVIKKTIQEIQRCLIDNLCSKIDNCTSYVEACKTLKQFNSSVMPVGRDVYWKNSLVYPDCINFSKVFKEIDARIDSWTFRKTRGSYSEKWAKRIKENVWLPIREKLLIHDKSSVSRVFVEGYQEANIEREPFRILVVKNGDVNGLRQLIKDKIGIDIDEVGYEKISKYAKLDVKRSRNYSNAWIFDGNNFKPLKINPKDGSGIYVSLMNRKKTIRASVDGHYIHTCRELSRTLDYLKIPHINVYGIKDNVINKLGDNWIPLQQCIEKKVKEVKEKYPDKKQKELHASEIALEYCDNLNVIYIMELYGVGDNIVQKWHSLKKDVQKDQKEYQKMKDVFNSLGITITPSSDQEIEKHELVMLIKEADKKYPLLKFLEEYNSYSSKTKNKKKKAIQEYIDAMDSKSSMSFVKSFQDTAVKEAV